MFLYRRKKALTQRACAQELGVTAVKYGRFERQDMRTVYRPEKPTIEYSKLELCVILRKREKISQVHLARAIGISAYWLRQMEKGKCNSKRLVDFWDARIL
jgi:transcriptional regulator with XRE-family HTH domain